MNVSPQSDIYEFSEFRVDAVKRLLTKRGGGVAPLAPKAFETLLYLVRHPGELLEKEEMMRAIWVDTIVEENNLNQSISAVRRVLGERHDEHRFIVTVPGRGYKFVSEVRRIEEGEKGRKGEEEIINDAVMSEEGSASASALNLSEPPASAGGFADFGFRISDFGFQNEDQKPNTEYRKSNEKPKTEDQITINDAQPLTNEIPNPKSQIPNRKWLIGLIIFSVLGLSSMGFYLWRENAKPATAAPIKTVAVLPFKPLVAENRNEALELGMADTLISKLSDGEEIIVRPLDSVRRSVLSERDSLIVGRELNVEAILDGSIQTSGERIRISARLLRTSDGKQLWAGQFDEKFTDIFAVQDAISQRVAAALQTRLGSREKKRQTENIEAYQLYMKGRFHAARLIQPETAKGIAYFQQAIEIDPNYALAYVALSVAFRQFTLTSDVPSSETMPKAKAAALRAIEIDETLAAAHLALGITAFWYDWDWQATEKHYLRAIELDPNNANPHRAYAHFLSNTAQHEKALVEAKRGRELDPLTLSSNALEGQYLFYAGKHDEALDQLNKTIDLDANFWLAHLIISRVYSEKGMHAEAIAAATKAKELSKVNSESIALIGYSQAKSGETEKARAVLDELLKLSATRYVPPYNFALIYNALGESDKALDYLEKGFAEKDVRMVFLKVEPKWNNLRNEPRFVDLMRRMNFE